ncbi:RICIN domain-containing protein [Natrarchaeobius sp. A-rgal3]|uniref:RICIN domain-containing protein n=1 Tax=Natrarchaeobius versutus TaxID=1679078 RepID=UPI00350EF9BF
MTKKPTADRDHDASPSDRSRRTFLGLAGATLAAGWVGTASADSHSIEVSLTENVGADSPSSPIAPDDGWADTGWITEETLQVVRVTTLDAEGEGSLKWACEDVDGPRIVVFEVGGVIDMEGGDIEAEEPYLYVAGQTAPPPGITVIRTTKPGFEFDEGNMFVQHIRSRPGDDVEYGEPADAMVVGDNGYNVAFDHCSVSWGTEENMSVNSEPSISEDVTFTNNLNAEGLFDSPVHADDDQRAYGSLIGEGTDRVAILGNVYAQNWSRNARIKGGTSAVVANNVQHNFERATRLGGDSSETTSTSVVGNVYTEGDASDTGRPIVYTGLGDGDPPVEAYVADNESGPFSMIDGDSPIDQLSSPSHWPDGFDPIGGDVFGNRLEAVGARPAERTFHDQRIVDDVSNGDGTIIDSQAEVGGYPDLESTYRPLTVPEDDAAFTDWLQQHTQAVELASVDPPEGNDSGGEEPAPIPSGTYWLESVHSGKAVEVFEWSGEDGATVVQWEQLGGDNQRWVVDHLTDDVYRFENVFSGKYLTVADGSTDDGANVVQWEWTGGDHQRFHVEAITGDEYAVRPVHSGSSLDVEGFSTDDGATVVQWEYHADDNQRWRFHEP